MLVVPTTMYGWESRWWRRLIPWTSRKTSKGFYSTGSLEHHWRQKWQNWAVLFQTRHKKPGFFRRGKNAGENSRQQENREPSRRWIESIKNHRQILRGWARLLRTGHCGHHSFMGSSGTGALSAACNTGLHIHHNQYKTVLSPQQCFWLPFYTIPTVSLSPHNHLNPWRPLICLNF